MIEVICSEPEGAPGRLLNDRKALLAALEERGLQCKRVERPTLTAVVLCFAPLQGTFVEEMAPDLRRQLVLVDEEGRTYEAEAEETRSSHGLLGLVEPGAWSNWQRGLFVAWGVFGREDVATRAGLTPRPRVGLQAAKDRVPLPDLLARFLIAAEADLEDANP